MSGRSGAKESTLEVCIIRMADAVRKLLHRGHRMYMQFRQHLTRFPGKRLGTDKRKAAGAGGLAVCSKWECWATLSSGYHSNSSDY